MLEVGMQPLPGLRLAQRLGQGSFGSVWEAVQGDGQVFALKFLDCRQQDSIMVSNEVRTLLRLKELHHPRIIRLFDVCATKQYLILKMEKADGNLRELSQVYLEETGQNIPADHLLELLDQAAEALDFLGEQPKPGLGSGGQGMQHCDVKPSNLLILEDGLKVVDFGLAMSSLASTYGNRFMGTPPYAAPELYDGRVAAHTDQYALAITWVELATGGRALTNARWPMLPVDPKKLRLKERDVVLKAVDYNWMNRWPNCKSFLAALRTALNLQQPSKGRKLGSRELARLYG